MKNRQVVLARVPDALPTAADFDVRDVELPQLSSGEVLCSNQILSLDPYVRSQMAGRHGVGNLALGDVINGETIATVIDSKNATIPVGTCVRCQGKWQEFCILGENELVVQSDAIKPASYGLSVLGMPGLTAFAGLNWLSSVSTGETVVVPAATGAVGATVVQLATKAGCRVIGVAGSDAKCDYAMNQLHVHACINRRKEDVAERIKSLCPDGVDFYFDLVGGELLHLICANLAVGARIILCGLMAEYNSVKRSLGPMPGLLIASRAQMLGLVVYDFEDRRDEFIAACLPLVQQGELKMHETSEYGLEQAPSLFCKLMNGDTTGKTLIYLDEDAQ
ncbi:MAG: NADP-dependent oxidoreductase [Gammaproteobacteria bacterium]|nr:NADP-dependent oxidoreductase [Gammaproteobacteria bacterium]